MYDLPRRLPEPNEFGSYYFGERPDRAAIHRVRGGPRDGRYMAFRRPEGDDAGLILAPGGGVATFATPQEALEALRKDAGRRGGGGVRK